MLTAPLKRERDKEKNMFYPYNKYCKEFARKLRKNMTPEEKKLWYQFLKYTNRKILRQKIIGNYIVDFYCAKKKLVIEIDGRQHYTKEGLRKDEIRTKYLNSLNLKVIRFTNDEVRNNFNNVCNKIKKELI